MLADIPPPDLSMLLPAPTCPLPQAPQQQTPAGDKGNISDAQLAAWAIASGLAQFLDDPSMLPSSGKHASALPPASPLVPPARARMGTCGGKEDERPAAIPAQTKPRRHSVEVGSLSVGNAKSFGKGPELFAIAEEWSSDGRKIFSWSESRPEPEVDSFSAPPPLPPRSDDDFGPVADKHSDNKGKSAKAPKKDKTRRFSLRKALSRSSTSEHQNPFDYNLTSLKEDEELSPLDEDMLKKAEAAISCKSVEVPAVSVKQKSSSSKEDVKTVKMLRRRSTGFLHFRSKDKDEKKQREEEAKYQAKMKKEFEQHRHSGWEFIESTAVSDDLWKAEEYSG